MIQQENLADARGRLTTDEDRSLFDEALRRAQTLEPFARDVVEAALSLAELHPADLLYQQTIYPFDTPAAAKQMALGDGHNPPQSGCGLTTEEVWRRGGVQHPILRAPYASRVIAGGIRYAVTLEKHIAVERGSWLDAAHLSSIEIEPADAVIIGCKTCPGVWARNTFRDEHELTAIAVDRIEDDDGNVTTLIHSLDGGQPHIALRTRKLVFVPDRNEVWLADLRATIEADGRPSKGRRILGLIRARRLASRLAA